MSTSDPAVGVGSLASASASDASDASEASAPAERSATGPQLHRSTFSIAPDHPCLPGHFPGAPIVPGVVMLDEAFRALGLDASTPLKIDWVKFARPLLPGEVATVEATVEAAVGAAAEGPGAGRLAIRFSIRHATELLARGALTVLGASVVGPGPDAAGCGAGCAPGDAAGDAAGDA
jgi:hypothetical protein